MSPEMNMGIVYENNLDTDKFARMFNNKAQSYKFYWFEAILNLTMETDEDLSFEDVIDEMICEASLSDASDTDRRGSYPFYKADH